MHTYICIHWNTIICKLATLDHLFSKSLFTTRKVIQRAILFRRYWQICWVVLSKNSLHSFPAVMPANQILVSQKGKTLWCLHLVVTQYHWEDAIHLICLCLTCCTCFLPFNLCKKHILYHQQVMFSVCYFVSRAGTLGFMTAAGTLPKTRGPSRPCHAVSTHQQITAV